MDALKRFISFVREYYAHSAGMIFSLIIVSILVCHTVLYLFYPPYSDLFIGLESFGNAIALIGFFVIPGVIIEYQVRANSNLQFLEFEKVGKRSWALLISGLVICLGFLYPFLLADFTSSMIFFFGTMLVFFSFLSFLKENLQKRVWKKIKKRYRYFAIGAPTLAFYLTVDLFSELNSAFPISQTFFSFTITFGLLMKNGIAIFILYLFAVMVVTSYFKTKTGVKPRKIPNDDWCFSLNILLIRKFFVFVFLLSINLIYHLFIILLLITKKILLFFPKLIFATVMLIGGKKKVLPVNKPTAVQVFWGLHYFIVASIVVFFAGLILTSEGRTRYWKKVAYEIDFNENFICKKYIELNADEKQKKLKAIPLSPDQTRVYYVLYQEDAKNDEFVGDFFDCSKYLVSSRQVTINVRL